jgi:UDP-2,3-diacylglucosamine pyrophosphatase LpxH
MLARIIGSFQWILSRLGLNTKAFVRNLLHSIAAKLQDKQFDDLVSDIEKEAIDKYKSVYDVVVMGHTHLPKIVEGECTYVNIGDWTYNRTYVLFEDGQFMLKGERHGMV